MQGSWDAVQLGYLIGNIYCIYIECHFEPYLWRSDQEQAHHELMCIHYYSHVGHASHRYKEPK